MTTGAQADLLVSPDPLAVEGTRAWFTARVVTSDWLATDGARRKSPSVLSGVPHLVDC